MMIGESETKIIIMIGGKRNRQKKKGEIKKETKRRQKKRKQRRKIREKKTFNENVHNQYVRFFAARVVCVYDTSENG